MSDPVRPHRQQPTRLPRLWDSPGKNTGVGCHFLLQCMKVKMKFLSRVRLLATPWTAAYQAPPSMGFSRQEHWSGLPFPSPMHEVCSPTFNSNSLFSNDSVRIKPNTICEIAKKYYLWETFEILWTLGINSFPNDYWGLKLIFLN